MTTPPPRTPRSGDSRGRVLQALRETAEGCGVAELAEHVGLHPNTVRFHLDQLAAQGRVVRHVEARDAPGRPRLRFTAAPPRDGGDPEGDRRSYRLLAEILAGYVAAATPDPVAAGTSAGRTWGRYLTTRPAPYRHTERDAALAELSRILAEIGFAPETADTADGPEIRVHHCPFLEVAQEHREVACAVHLGLMQGALEEMRAPLTAARLEPFVTPTLCVAHLAEAAAPDRAG